MDLVLDYGLDKSDGFYRGFVHFAGYKHHLRDCYEVVLRRLVLRCCLPVGSLLKTWVPYLSYEFILYWSFRF